MRVLFALPLVALAACGSVEPTLPDAGKESGSDAGGDAGSDGGSDGGSDAGVPWAPEPIAWGPCANATGWECGVMKVPADYAAPKALLGIAVTRRAATDRSRRLGVLLFNPGGPGRSGVDRMRTLVFDVMPELGEVFDLVGFDPRGTGASEPSLRCFSDAQIEAFRIIDAAADAGAAQQLEDQRRAACLAQVGAERLATVGSLDVARDMNTLRILLGEERLNYLGGSYGGYLGAVFASLFPDRVRAFVLDSAPTSDFASTRWLVQQAQSVEDRVSEFLGWCAANRCVLAADGSAATARAALDQAFARTDAQTVTGGRRPVSSRDLRTFLVDRLRRGTASYVDLSLGVKLVLDGDGQRFMEVADALAGRTATGTYPASSSDAHTAISCVDGLAEWTPATFAEGLSAMRAVSPRFGVIDFYNYAACVNWPAPAKRPRIDAKAAPPLLVLEGQHDPAAPAAGTRELLAALGNGSKLYSYPLDGHVTYQRNAVRMRVQAFLIEPSAVGGGPVECSSWPRPAALASDRPFKTFVENTGAATMTLVDVSTGMVLGRQDIAANDPTGNVSLTVPAGYAQPHVIVRMEGPDFLSTRWYFDTHRLVLPAPPLLALTPASLSSFATAGGVVADPAIGTVRANLLDCDGLPLAGAKLVLAGATLRYTAGAACTVSPTASEAAAGCPTAFAFNVPPGVYPTGLESGSASWPGPTITLEAGSVAELVLTPEG